MISALTRGGPGNALMTAAGASSAWADIDHALVSLKAPDPMMVRQAQDRGMRVHPTGELASVTGLMASADVVQLHFWNSPALYQLLGTPLPKMRLLVWSHISGERRPAVLPPEVLRLADLALASCEYTTTLAGLERLAWIPAVPGWDRVQGVKPNPSREFTVGYLGKLDFAKLHPQFIDLCASIEVPHARFLVCGEGGALRQLRVQAANHGIAERVDFRGFVEDVRNAFADMDVFGYPLAPDTSAASELALQEAMYAGIPPVVLGPPAVCRHVIDGQTGLVARSPCEYVRAIAHLHAHPQERTRIGRAAREFAASRWSPDQIGRRWAEVYAELAGQPKRGRPCFLLADGGAARFVESLGGGDSPFLASMNSIGTGVVEFDEEISRSPDILWAADGGILSYRDFYPEDPHLRLWSGLVLRRHGHPAMAAGEFAAAIRLGLDEVRVRRYLAAAAQEAGAGPGAQLSPAL